MNDVLILASLLLLSGAFSGSETALTAVSLARAGALEKEGRRGAKALHYLKQNSTSMLIALLIGNNLVNIGASAFATVVATEHLGALGPGVAVGVLTLLILVFGEITPKSLAIRHSVAASLVVAPIVLFLMKALSPLVWMFEYLINLVHKMTNIKESPTVTESELMGMLMHGTQEGTIEKGEANIIEKVFAFNDLTVSEVMTGRHKLFALNEETTINEALPKILDVGFSRIPIYRGSMENISRIVHWHDIATAITKSQIEKPLKEIGIEPIFVPLNQPIDQLFTNLKRQKRHLAIVVDQEGILRGLVTMEDLLEQLVGEIYDETDKAHSSGITKTDDGIEVEGGLELRLIKRYLSADLQGKHSETVSHWIINDIAKIPETDERFEIDGLTVIIQQSSGRHIHKVKILVPQEMNDVQHTQSNEVGTNAVSD